MARSGGKRRSGQPKARCPSILRLDTDWQGSAARLSRPAVWSSSVLHGDCSFSCLGKLPFADSTPTVHTTDMSIKTSAFLALIGTILLTVLVTADFINTVAGIMHDVVPAVALLRSLIYLLASLTVTVFFYVFQKSQS
jgi:hypothetical protein